MGLISSYQSEKGIILLRYSKDFGREVMELLASLSPLLRKMLKTPSYPFNNVNIL